MPIALRIAVPTVDRKSSLTMSDQATQAANSTEPKYTIEYFMAQGMSRVQAIKAVYVANAKSKRRSSIPTDIPAEVIISYILFQDVVIDSDWLELG